MGRLEHAPEQSEKSSQAEGADFEHPLEQAEAFDAAAAGSGESTIEGLREHGSQELSSEARTIFLRRAQRMEVLFDQVKESVVVAETIAGDLERAMRSQNFGEWISRRMVAVLELAEGGIFPTLKRFIPDWLKGQEEETVDAMPTRERALTFLGQLRVVGRIVDASREEIQKMASVRTHEEALEVLTKVNALKNSLVNSWDGASVWVRYMREPSMLRELFQELFPFIGALERDNQQRIYEGVDGFASSVSAAVEGMRDTGTMAGEVVLASQEGRDIQQIIRGRLLSGALTSEEARGLVPEELLDAAEFERLAAELRPLFVQTEQRLVEGGRGLAWVARHFAEVISRSRGRLIDSVTADHLIDIATKMQQGPPERYKVEFIRAFRNCRNSLIDRLAAEQSAKKGE